LPDKDLVNLCPPIEPYQVTKNLIVSLQEAQAKLPELIYNLKLGEELLITDNNLPLAKLIGQS
jgi:hypothetical protein